MVRDNQYTNPVASLSNRKNKVNIWDVPAKLGRNENAVDVYLFHESISREHCMFEMINGRFTVKDLGSTVGTFVNGTRLEPNIPYYINDGDKIVIGKVKLEFSCDLNEIMRRQACPPAGQDRPPVYDQRPPEYDQRPPVYDQRPPVYDQRSPVYDQRPPMYDQRPPEYEQRQPADGLIPLSDRKPPQENRPAAHAGMGRPEISARKLSEFEFNEDEVVYVDCGLGTPAVQRSYTQELRRKEMEPAAGAGVVRMKWYDDEEGKFKTILIDHFPFRIGRKSSENDYAVSRKGLSRRHMIVENAGGVYCIVDDGSTNGIRLNGEKIEANTRKNIRTGDVIRIAGIDFLVETE